VLVEARENKIINVTVATTKGIFHLPKGNTILLTASGLEYTNDQRVWKGEKYIRLQKLIDYIPIRSNMDPKTTQYPDTTYSLTPQIKAIKLLAIVK